MKYVFFILKLNEDLLLSVNMRQLLVNLNDSNKKERERKQIDNYLI